MKANIEEIKKEISSACESDKQVEVYVWEDYKHVGRVLVKEYPVNNCTSNKKTFEVESDCFRLLRYVKEQFTDLPEKIVRVYLNGKGVNC